MIGSIALIVVAALLIAAGALLFKKLRPGTSHGSAALGAWAGELAADAGSLPAGLVLGRDGSGRLAGWSGQGHWLLVAPTGAGKSTGVLVPSICHWQSSLIAVDVKGELAQACAPALRAHGVRCVRLDPYDVLDAGSGIDKIAVDPVALAADAAEPVEAMRMLAETLMDPPAASERHWTEAGRLVLSGMIAAASCATSQAKQGLRGVAYLADTGHDAIKLLPRLRWPSAVEPQVMRAVSLLADAGANERGAILSTVRRQLDFLASAPALDALSGSWTPAQLLDEKRPAALFVILPADRLATQARLLRIVVSIVSSALIAAGTSRSRRVLFALDEAAALGRLAAVEQGIGLLRGYGAHFVLAFQDHAQIVGAYGEAAARSLAANSHALYWACRDLATAKHVSELLGERTVLSKSRDLARLPLGAAGHSAERETARSLLSPDEIRRLPGGALLAFVAGRRPTRLQLLAPGEFAGF